MAPCPACELGARLVDWQLEREQSPDRNALFAVALLRYRRGPGGLPALFGKPTAQCGVVPVASCGKSLNWPVILVLVLAGSSGCATDAEPPAAVAEIVGCQSDAACGGLTTACAVGRCSAGSCTASPVADGTSCAGDNRCLLAPTCNAGLCKGGNPLACADESACTEDGCDPKTGCYFVALGSRCEDDNVCTTDSCGAAGCVHTPRSGLCNDGDICTSDDACVAGACTGQPTTDCDDGNLCTTDSCDAELACIHVQNTAPCDDGDPATSKDTCANGKCGGS